MSWLTWPFRAVAFAFWFTVQVAISNYTVVRDNLTPGQDSTPGVAKLETRCRTDLEITVLAALITLTPGTLTLGTVGPARASGTRVAESAPTPRVLYVHGMYHREPDSLRAELQTIETRLLRAMRREGGTL